MNFALEIVYFNQLPNRLRRSPLFPKCLFVELTFWIFFKVPHLQESMGLNIIVDTSLV